MLQAVYALPLLPNYSTFIVCIIVASECKLNPANYTVIEADNAFVDVIVERNNPVGVGSACVLSTEDISATRGN